MSRCFSYRIVLASLCLGLVLPATAQLLAAEQANVQRATQKKMGATKKPNQSAAAVIVPPAPKKPVLLPGTGSLVKGVGDDFEDEKWRWNYNHPKSSEEQDKRMRSPMAKSVNGKWFEGPKRGTLPASKEVNTAS